MDKLQLKVKAYKRQAEEAVSNFFIQMKRHLFLKSFHTKVHFRQIFTFYLLSVFCVLEHLQRIVIQV